MGFLSQLGSEQIASDSATNFEVNAGVADQAVYEEVLPTSGKPVTGEDKPRP